MTGVQTCALPICHSNKNSFWTTDRLTIPTNVCGWFSFSSSDNLPTSHAVLLMWNPSEFLSDFAHMFVLIVWRWSRIMCACSWRLKKSFRFAGNHSYKPLRLYTYRSIWMTRTQKNLVEPAGRAVEQTTISWQKFPLQQEKEGGMWERNAHSKQK